MVFDAGSRRGSTRDFLTFESPGDDLGTARAHIQRWLESRGVPAPTCADIVLAASELLTNAAEHGEGPATVSCRSALGSVTMSVTNHANGADVPEPEQWQLPDPLAISNRGLGIVAVLADDVAMRSVDHRITIEATFEVDNAVASPRQATTPCRGRLSRGRTTPQRRGPANAH